MTLDEKAILRAIMDTPEDDLPRLAYADWCEEQGNLARAEFVRVQLELATIEAVEHDCGDNGEGETTCPACGAYCFAEELEVCSRNLLHAEVFGGRGTLHTNEVDWLLPVQILLAGTNFNWRWRRGFVDWLELSTADFLRHAAELFRCQPIEEVTLSDAPEPFRTIVNGSFLVHRGRWRDHLRNIQIAGDGIDSPRRELALIAAICSLVSSP